MLNINIDDQIVKSYLEQNNMFIHASDDVYMIGPKHEEISIFEEPNKDGITRVNEIHKLLINSLNTFTFKNPQKVKEYLGDINDILSTLTIKLVVGMPKGITKIFRLIGDNQLLVVFDLYNITLQKKDMKIIINDLMDYLCYVICLMTIDARIEPEVNNMIGVLHHSIYSTSFAYYLADSEQLKRMEKNSEYGTILYIEEAALRKIAKEKKEEAARKFLNNVIQLNPEMEYLGITGKTYLTILKESGKNDTIKQLFHKGSENFVKAISKSAVVKKTNLFRFYLFWTILLPISALLIVGWAIIEINRRSFSFTLKILPLVFAFIIVVHQILKILTKQTKSLTFFLYLTIVFLLTAFYLIFLFTFT